MRKTGKLKNDPPVKPVRSIEVPVKVTKKKVLLIAVLFAVGITLIVWAITKFLTVPKGWQMIEAPAGLEDTYAYEVSLQYLLGETDQKVNREKTAVTEAYVEAAGNAYRIFSELENRDVKNIYYINHHLGETVKVDPALYAAFSLLTMGETRAMYLGPIYENNRLVLSEKEDILAEDYDPVANEVIKEMYQQLLSYLNAPEHITLELLGNHNVRLNVSQEYQQYMQENSLEEYIALDWMRNAFVTDYIADALIEKGYKNGILTSYDGYIRNLDNTGRVMELAVFDGTVNRNYRVATMQSGNAGAMVWMRDYPISIDEEYEYHYWADGRVSHTRLDVADGMSKAVCSDFVAYSKNLSCAQVLMQTINVYIADSMDWAKVKALPAQGVEFVIVNEEALYVSDRNATFANLVYGEPKYELPGGEE